MSAANKRARPTLAQIGIARSIFADIVVCGRAAPATRHVNSVRHWRKAFELSRVGCAPRENCVAMAATATIARARHGVECLDFIQEPRSGTVFLISSIRQSCDRTGRYLNSASQKEGNSQAG